jgi:hypothetical protein
VTFQSAEVVRRVSRYCLSDSVVIATLITGFLRGQVKFLGFDIQERWSKMYGVMIRK